MTQIDPCQITSTRPQAAGRSNPVHIYYEKDIPAETLRHATIAVLGFGSQGHAHALNLKESGHSVLVGLPPASRRRRTVQESGLTPLTVAEAVRAADAVMMLVPDEVHGPLFRAEIAPHMHPGQTLMTAHGFSLLYGQVTPPPDCDVVMVAPKGPGHLVRREFVQGRGVPALCAVHQDASGKALQTALAYAAGIGAARAGVIATTVREETETDLFGEQAVLCGGVTALMKAGYETLVAAGYPPELAYFECIHEMKLIVDLIHEGGLERMRDSVSNTAEYGDYITQEKLVTPAVREAMARILADIQSGRFANAWILENQAGQPSFQAMRRREREHGVESVGAELRRMMPWLQERAGRREEGGGRP